MATKYFDVAGNYGFTARITYEEHSGALTITDVQVKTTAGYTGRWYPNGNISVNGVVVLNMSYYSPVSHYFAVNANDTFVSIVKQSGSALPVSSCKVTTSKATLSVDIELYKDDSSPLPRIKGSVDIPVLSGAVRIKTPASFKRALPYVRLNGKWKRLIPHKRDGATYKQCT